MKPWDYLAHGDQGWSKRQDRKSRACFSLKVKKNRFIGNPHFKQFLRNTLFFFITNVTCDY